MEYFVANFVFCRAERIVYCVCVCVANELPRLFSSYGKYEIAIITFSYLLLFPLILSFDYYESLFIHIYSMMYADASFCLLCLHWNEIRVCARCTMHIAVGILLHAAGVRCAAALCWCGIQLRIANAQCTWWCIQPPLDSDAHQFSAREWCMRYILQYELVWADGIKSNTSSSTCVNA